MHRVQSPAPNLVKRRFDVTAPNKIWIGDMIAMRTKEGWLHFPVVLNLFARRVAAWSMHTTHATTSPMAALNMALAQRKLGTGLIFHSDQVTVYGSNDYGELLQATGLLPSVSRKGNCWDNAVTESFFQT
jgi:putative transposase